MTILAIWWYERDDLRGVFDSLPATVELVYIYRRRPTAGSSYQGRGIVLYWTDFANPYEILDRVKPDKLVFQTIGHDSSYVALSLAARQRGIPVLIMDHGIFSRLHSEPPMAQRMDRAWNLRFSLSSFGTRVGWEWLRFLQLQLLKLLKRPVKDSDPRFQKLRRADQYLTYCPYNQRFHKARDHVPDDVFVLTGILAFDGWAALESHPNDEMGKAYMLLIDQPLSGGDNCDFFLPQSDKEELLRTLDIFAGANGMELLVKLHPIDYAKADPFAGQNVRFLRQVADLGQLVKGASGIFGFFSTLQLPAILLAPNILFRHPSFPDLVNDIAEFGVISVYDIGSFTAAHLSFDIPSRTVENLARYTHEFLYCLDGKSTKRSVEALLKAWSGPRRRSGLSGTL